MMQWKRYGLIWMSAGMFITGAGTLWYQRQSPVVHGEDIAEVRANCEEIKLAMMHGSDHPTKYDSTVTNWITSTNVISVITFNPYYGYSSKISVSPSTFTFTDKNWNTPQWMTVSVGPTAGAYDFSYYHPTVDGIVKPSIDLQVSYNFGNDYWNGGGGDSYLQVQYLNIHLQAGHSMSNAIMLLHAPTNNPTITTNGFTVGTNVVASGRIDDYMRIKPWTDAMSDIRKIVNFRGTEDGFVTQPYIAFVDTDWEPSDGDSLVEQTYQLMAATNTISWADGTEGKFIEYYQGAPTGVVQIAQTMDTWIIDTNAVKVWKGHSGTSYANITNTPLVYDVVGSGHDGVALDWSWYGGAWWSQYVSTNLWYFSAWEHGKTNAYGTETVVFDYTIKTSHLDMAKSFLNKLTRTVAVLQGGEYYSVTGGVSYTVTGIDGDIGYSESKEALESPSLPSSKTVETNALSVFSKHGDWKWTAESGASYTNGESPIVYSWSWNSSAHSTYGRSVCELQYPCDYALTNGYVSRVRVFGVFSVRHITTPNSDWNMVYFDANDSYEQIWKTPTLPIGSMGETYYDQDFPSGFPATYSKSIVNGLLLDDDIRGTKMTLLSDVADPTHRISVTLGDSSSEWYPDMSMMWGLEERGVWKDESGNNTKKRTAYYYASYTMNLDAFVVVVDWKWKHLNDDQPYDPTPYTPPWATNTVTVP